VFDLFSAVIKRDLKIGFTDLQRALTPLFFFALVITLMPLGLGPNPKLLAEIAPGIVWVIALLAILISTDRVFSDDLADGSLQQYVVSGKSLLIISLAKVTAWWCMTMLPLALAAPILSMMLGLDSSASLTLMISLLIGGVGLCLVGGIAAALTLSGGGSGALIALISLPLYVPILIFGSAAVQAAALGLTVKPYLLILAAFDMIALPLAPLAIAAAIRLSLDD